MTTYVKPYTNEKENIMDCEATEPNELTDDKCMKILIKRINQYRLIREGAR